MWNNSHCVAEAQKQFPNYQEGLMACAITYTDHEEWEYANSTIPKRFTKHNISEQFSGVEYASPDATSYDAQKWLWQYRKGAFDTREQKRLLISPHGDGTDDNDDEYAHLWEYTLSGAAGELYVLYKGLQTATDTEPYTGKTDAGRRVYISPFKYYAAGGELQFQADGTTKEVHITDNLGSVRSIVIWDNVGLKDIKSFDYKPFGELDGGDEPTKHGFATAEYDGESSCFAMGMRMYSAELGRFLSVDPLFEAMPRHTPYHYSFNSPLVWRDPSGLLPEKEKDQDRLMTIEFDEAKFAEEAYNRISEENYRSALFGTMMGKMLYGLPGSYAEAHEWYLNSMGGPGGGGGRTGEDGSGDNGKTSEKRDRIPDRKLGKLTDSEMDSFADLTKDLDEELREKTKNDKREWGYFMTLDKDGNLWARYITSAPYGNPDTWMSFSQSGDKPPFDVPDGERFLGFNHTHTEISCGYTNSVNKFSASDWGAFVGIMNNWNKAAWKLPKDKSYLIMGVITPNERQFIKPSVPNFTLYQENMMNLLQKDLNSRNPYSKFFTNPTYYFNLRTGFEFKNYRWRK